MPTKPFIPKQSVVQDKAQQLPATPAMGAWMEFVTTQANSGSGAVMSVTATAPIASSGGANPNISHNVSGVVAGVYGDDTTIPQVTVDTFGHVTDAVNVPITFPTSVTSVTGTAPIASSGGTTPDISLNDTAVTPGTYGSASNVGQFTVDQKGRLTFAGNVAITSSSTVIGLDRLLGDGATTAFNLADLAEYVVAVSDAGLIVDPAIYSLSSSRAQVVFDTAPTSGHVLTFEYVEATA